MLFLLGFGAGMVELGIGIGVRRDLLTYFSLSSIIVFQII
jgi:hypothetical protein